ncbi:HD domain-containing phosphohydrolase [Chitinivibrio alkaliphilus]|uniref:Response regulator n=1 Tax=Chitinivibrio alkaliphilus ACht1 TaxID=1313304 RepID=U7D9T5_9BACT|nr:HD domain-containing phosphohydrolase [Chitinivibrio alkaliphilus]ERP39164.1 response regulator [Chitinivibrio alkaliphilus ACht1]
MYEDAAHLGEKESGKILKNLLTSIAHVMAEKDDISVLLKEFSLLAHSIVPSDRCTIWVHSVKERRLWTRLADGIETIRVSDTEGVVGLCFQRREPVIINDPYNDSRFNASIDKETGYTTQSIIALPLTTSNGEIVGVFQALNRLSPKGTISRKGYQEQDIRYLNIVTVYIAREIDAHLLRDELTQTQNEIVFTLAETAEMRSRETGYHVKRVSEYCRFIAEHLGYSREECDVLGVASSLHDIGKIAIPDKILLKNGRLTADEFGVMKRHSRLGYDMLKHSNRALLQAAAWIALEHHERWDGAGYPAGKSGTDIHEYGRIVAVADVFDALASKRCYKSAWPHEKIIALFEKERGKQFDPRITDIFLENQAVFIDIRTRFQD